MNVTTNITEAATNITTSSVHRINFIQTDVHAIEIMFHVDRVITYIFFIEILVRFLTSPKKCIFLKSVFNWIDILAVFPWAFIAIYIHMAGKRFTDYAEHSNLSYYFQASGTMRVIRLITLARHHVASLVFLVTLWESRKEIFLLLSLYLSSAVFFATAVYYAEKGNNEEFNTIMSGLWWALITMTSVGYGDIYPRTELGKTLGVMCAFSGVIATALPIAVISTNYSNIYRAAKVKQRLIVRNKETINNNNAHYITTEKL